MRATLLPLIVTVLVGGCGDDDTPCDFVGDRSAAAELELRIFDESTAADISDGARVPLIQPPQGGKVIFAGGRARNVCAGVVQILGYVRDGTTATSPIVGLEGRPITLVAAGDGWAYPSEPMQVSSYANIPMCPNTASTRDIYEQPYRLAIKLTDAEQHVVEKSVTITPFCDARTERDCRCTCKQGYRLGDTCP